MKKAKVWLIVIPVLIVILGTAVFLVGKPVAGVASSLLSLNNTKGYSFEANLDLDMDYISDQLGKVSVLTKLIPDLRLLEVKGVWRDGDARAFVYPFGEASSGNNEFTDVYYVNGEYYINLQKIFNYLEGKLGFLAKLVKIDFPDYTGAEYISYTDLCKLLNGIGDLFTKANGDDELTDDPKFWKNMKFKSFENGILYFQWTGKPFMADARLEKKDGEICIPFESVDHPLKCVIKCYGTIYADDAPLKIESFTTCNLDPLIDLFQRLQSSAE